MQQSSVEKFTNTLASIPKNSDEYKKYITNSLKSDNDTFLRYEKENIIKMYKPFEFLPLYRNEEVLYGSFQSCKDDNINCTTTTNELIKNNPDFLNRYSQYHKNFRLNNISNLSNNFINYNDVMNFKHFLAFRCLEISPKSFYEKMTKNGYPCINRNVYIYNEKLLIDFVYKEIQKIIYNNNCTEYNPYYTESKDPKYCKTNLHLDIQNNRRSNKIFGPVYVCISQAPYLNIQGKQVKARFDVVNNRRAYYVEEKINKSTITKSETGDEKSSFSSLYAEITIVFPLYKFTIAEQKDSIKISLSEDLNRIDKFIEILSNNVVSDELCHLKCNKSMLSCGCLNASRDVMKINKDSPSIANPYIDSLLSPSGINIYDSECLDNKNKKVDYSMLYFLNPYSSLFDSVISNILR